MPLLRNSNRAVPADFFVLYALFLLVLVLVLDFGFHWWRKITIWLRLRRAVFFCGYDLFDRIYPRASRNLFNSSAALPPNPGTSAICSSVAVRSR